MQLLLHITEPIEGMLQAYNVINKVTLKIAKNEYKLQAQMLIAFNLWTTCTEINRGQRIARRKCCLN
jgi:hypothetical protein